MKKKFAKKATNGSGRRMPKAIGHADGRRVSALRRRTPADEAPAPRVGRANVIPGNGDLPTSTEVAPEKVSIGEAMRKAVEELGETIINDELAASQLRQLAEAYEQVTREQAAFAKKSEEAKIAKKSLDGATEHLLGLVKEFTHPKPLPLFDMDQREADHAEMIEGAQELGLR
jgi:hypothetical protein